MTTEAPTTTELRTTPDIIALHRSLLDALTRADSLADHADVIGDLTFAYHVGRVKAAAWEGLSALLDARSTDRTERWG